MNKTKEEIMNSKFTMDWPMGIPFTEIYDAMQEYADQQTTHLTDQIKSMGEENIRISNEWAKQEIKLESLQKEKDNMFKTLKGEMAQVNSLQSKLTTSEAKLKEYEETISFLKERIEHLIQNKNKQAPF